MKRALAACVAATLASASAQAGERASSPALRTNLRPGQPAPAPVPAPKRFDPLAPMEPTENVPYYREPTFTFPVDLDCLAPLGSGSGNMAVWLGEFADDGPRFAEVELARDRAKSQGVVDRDGHPVLAGDDPLLLEAAPWMDQSTCLFFPDVWRFDAEAPLPPLLLARLLGNSWIARGSRTTDPAVAQADFRRAARLGRLLMQDDVFVVQDLFGRSILRQAVEGLRESARSEGDLVTLIAAERTLHALTRHRLLHRDRMDHFRLAWHDGRTDRMALRITDWTVRSLVWMAEWDPHRRYRIDALRTLNCVRGAGTRSQRQEAAEALERAAADASPFIAVTAAWAIASPPCAEQAASDELLGGDRIPAAVRARLRALR